MRDREALLREQVELKKENEALNSVMEVKQRLGEGSDQDIFEVLVENNSASRKVEDSCEFAPARLPEQNSYILQRQELIISSVPLSYNISCNASQNLSRINENEISMSNIGQLHTVNPSQLNTPSLKGENVYVRCGRTAEGTVRAFYLSLLQRKETSQLLGGVVDSLKHDIMAVIYEPYPTNEFWTDLLCNFLKIVHEAHFDTPTELLDYLKMHRLIDTLFVRCLRTRVDFLFDARDHQPSTREVLTALSNEFGLRLDALEGEQYLFFLKEERDFNLLESHHASLNASMIQKDSLSDEPCFAIYEDQDWLQFPFSVAPPRGPPGLSQFQMKEVLDFQEKLHSFRGSEENEQSMGWRDQHSGCSGNSALRELRERDLNSLEEEKRLKRVHPFKDYNPRSDMLLCEPLNSSRFFLNRVSSKRSDFDERA